MPPTLFCALLLCSPQVGGEWSVRRELAPVFEATPLVSFDTVRDWNGDGIDELLAGTGDVCLLLDGGDGRELLRLTDPRRDGGFGWRVRGLPDLDRDGFADWAVSDAGGLESVYLCSGRTGALLRRLFHPAGAIPAAEFGKVVLPFPDLDGDGIPELLIGAPDDSAFLPAAGSCFLFSGASGTLLHRAQGRNAGDHFGAALALLPDQDGDGVPDFAAGAPSSASGAATSGEVVVLAGATGAVLGSLPAPSGLAHFGKALAGGGDLDGDAVPDLVVASDGGVDLFAGIGFAALAHATVPEANEALALPGDLDGNGRSEILAGSARGKVHVLRDDGTQITTLNPAMPSAGFGAQIAGGRRYDGDGVPDFAVLESPGPQSRIESGSISVYAGAGLRLLHRTFAEPPAPRLGQAIALVGDWNGDGLDDVALGLPGATHLGSPEHGSACVVSGADGALLRLWTGAEARAHFGAAVLAAGDHDGDGRPDLLVGAPESDRGGTDSGAAFLFGSATGALLRSWDGPVAGGLFGHALARLDDLDGDGVEELVVGAPAQYSTSAPDCAVYVLATGSAGYHAQFPYPGGTRYGQALAGGGDADGDGVADLLIGAPRDAVSNGLVELRSGATGNLLRSFSEPPPSQHPREFGASLAWVGDLDGDAREDYAVGAPTATPGTYLTRVGQVWLYSSASGGGLGMIQGDWYGERLGSAVLGLGDVDADGVGDLALAAWWNSNGTTQFGGLVAIHSGRDLALLASIPFRHGFAVNTLAPAGNLAGDGAPGLLAGLPSSRDSRGMVALVGHDPFLALSPAAISAATGGAVEVRLDFPQSEAGQPYVVLASASGTGPSVLGGIEVPLAVDPLLRFSATPAAAVYLPGNVGRLDAAGDRALTMSFPPAALARFAGGNLHFAAVTAWDPQRARRSSAARALAVK